MSNYYLFIIQEANFQSRSILVPELEFNQSNRKKDIEILKKNSVKNIKFDIKGKDYLIDNLLFENIIWEGNCGQGEESEYSNIVNYLRYYADHDCDPTSEYGYGYLLNEDENWVKKSIANFCSGFNHIKNYDSCKKMKEVDNNKINIIDSFLVLQLRNGELILPPVDTVEEMYQKYYFNVK